MAAIGMLMGIVSTTTVSMSRCGVVVGSFDLTRGGIGSIASGEATEKFRAALVTAFPDIEFRETTALTPAFLSGVDVVILSSLRDHTLPTSLLTVTEQTALRQFVDAGGGAMIGAEGVFGANSQSYVTPFGMTLATATLNAEDTGPIVDLNHPIANGSFGPTSTLTTFLAGWFTNLGPATPLARLSSNGQPSLAIIERGALAPGSGAVLISTNTSQFGDEEDFGYFDLHESLALNAFEYVVPEPASWHLALAATLGWFACRGGTLRASIRLK